MAVFNFVHVLLVIVIHYLEIISASTIAPSPVISSVASLNNALKQEVQATPTAAWSMSQIISNISSTMQINGIISTSMILVNEIRVTSEVILAHSHTQSSTITTFGSLAETRNIHPSATMQSETSTISKFDANALTASPSVIQTSVTKQSSVVVASRSVNGDAERTSQVLTNHITTNTPTGPQPTTSAGAMTYSSETVSTSVTSKLNSLTTSTQKLGQETITAVNAKSSLPTTTSSSSSFSGNLMSSVQAPVTTSSPFIRNQYLIFGISGYLQNRTFSQDLADQTSHNYTILAMELSNTVSRRLMTMSPLYPCGKPCSTETHNETVKNLALFSAIINGINGFESQSRGSVFNSSLESKFDHIYTVTKVIHKSCSLIGTQGTAECGPK